MTISLGLPSIATVVMEGGCGRALQEYKQISAEEAQKKHDERFVGEARRRHDEETTIFDEIPNRVNRRLVTTQPAQFRCQQDYDQLFDTLDTFDQIALRMREIAELHEAREEQRKRILYLMEEQAAWCNEKQRRVAWLEEQRRLAEEQRQRNEAARRRWQYNQSRVRRCPGG